MKRIKYLLVATALGIAGNAAADPITVGGITWDPDVGADFDAGSSVWENFIDPGPDGVFGTTDDVEDTISGYGQINSINGYGASAFGNGFCEWGCQLTFAFGGFTINAAESDLSDPGSQHFVFDGGWVNWYVDDIATGTIMDFGDPASLTMADATDGTLWLSATSHTSWDATAGYMAALFGNGTSIGSGNDNGNGSGLLDIGSSTYGPGVANEHFDTNTLSDQASLGGGTDGFADLQFTSTFRPAGTTTADGKTLEGDTDFTGDSVAVPEPSSLVILGLSVLGLARLRRRNV